MLEQVKLAIENNITDVDDLVGLLEITIEDVMERFEDRLREHAGKFIDVPDEVDPGYDNHPA